MNMHLPLFHHTWQKNNARQLTQNLRNKNEYMLPIPRIEQFKNVLCVKNCLKKSWTKSTINWVSFCY